MRGDVVQNGKADGTTTEATACKHAKMLSRLRIVDNSGATSGIRIERTESVLCAMSRTD